MRPKTRTADGATPSSKTEIPQAPLMESYGTMTAAGLISLQLVYDQVYLEAELPFTGKFKAHCGQDVEKTRPIRESMRRAWAWMNAHYTADHVPMLPPDAASSFIEASQIYYLQTLARLGTQSGARLIGGRQWHRELTERLIRLQRADGSWGSIEETCFAVLALLDARRPVLVNKLRFGKPVDWNRDPRDMANLTQQFNQRFGEKTSWQPLDLDSELAALREAPVLYITGHQMPSLDEAALTAIRNHVWAGGTVLGVACCSAPEFTDGFLSTMRSLFPELSKTADATAREGAPSPSRSSDMEHLQRCRAGPRRPGSERLVPNADHRSYKRGVLRVASEFRQEAKSPF